MVVVRRNYTMQVKKMLKKISVLFLVIVLFVSTIPGNCIDAYAGNFIEVNEEKISSVSPKFELSNSKGYYPASFYYILSEHYRLAVALADGSNDDIYGWEPSGELEDDFCYQAEGGISGSYYMRFYDQVTEKQIRISKDYVPIGEWKVVITRDCPSFEEPVLETTVKIINPQVENTQNNTAEFSGTSEDGYLAKEIWYPLDLDQEKSYVFKQNWKSGSHFASIWTWNQEANVAVRVHSGQEYGCSEDADFTYMKEESQDVYLVMGTWADLCTGTITWKETKTISSILIEPKTFYKAWNRDMEQIPLTVDYTDGSSEKIDEWNSFYHISGIEGDVYVAGYYVFTENGDRICLGRKENGKWVDAYDYKEWMPGSCSWTAYVEKDTRIFCTGDITIADFDSTELELAEGKSFDFSITSENAAYYKCILNGSEKIEIINNSPVTMDMKVYYRISEAEPWNYKEGRTVEGLESEVFTLSNGVDSEGYEHLIVLYTEEEGTRTGTIGLLQEGTASTAQLNIESVKNSMFVWYDIPITVNFVGTDGSTKVGSQRINEWMLDSSSGTMYAYDKYGEKMIYALYQEKDLANISSIKAKALMDELRAAGYDEERIREILEAQGYEYSAEKNDTSTYTVKIYKEAIDEKNLIGTDTIEIRNSAAYGQIDGQFRIYGADRNETSLKVADQVKDALGVDKFRAFIIATGKDYADALTGSYLAKVKEAPILLTNSKEKSNRAMVDYILENAEADAKIYILGGINAVSAETEDLLKEQCGKDNVKRLAGENRLQTNTAVLMEAGFDGASDLLIATSKSFADSLSAAATGKPILLVNSEKELNEAQKYVIDIFSRWGNIYVLGGENAVSAKAVEAIAAETNGEKTAAEIEAARLEGKNRFETSVMIAAKFFAGAKSAIVACGSGNNYPDGLCGGALASALNVPLILTKNEDGQAEAYTKANDIKSGYVLGGPTELVSDDAAKKIFQAETIIYPEK